MVVAKPQHKALAIAVFAALWAMPQAYAQVAPADEEATTLATMTVTAQKREEITQNVPIAVTVLTEQQLRDTGVRDIKDLQVLVPGLTVTSTQSEAQTTARIRGIGTVGDNAGLESSVGVVIDGVYRARNGVGFGDLGEIERVEVLKGPQGTVFGKNTSAGVINIITRRPSYSQSVEGEFSLGNYGYWGISGAYNDALNDFAAFRVFAVKRSRDGFMDVNTGRGPRTLTEDNDQNFHSLRGQLLIEPTETFNINFIADYTVRDENCCAAVQTVVGSSSAIINGVGGPGSIATGTGPFPQKADPFARQAYSNRPTSQSMEDKGLSAEANWENSWLGGATLTSITAARDWQSINALDFDYTGADLLFRNAQEDESLTRFETFSQEFRLTGATDRFDWMVGAFYADEDLTRNDSYRIGSGYEPYLSTLILAGINPAFAGSPTAPLFISQATGRPFGTSFTGLGAKDRYAQNAKSTAFFTNNTWRATDALDLTMGLRYTNEKKTLSSVYTNPNGSPGCSSALTNPAQVVGALVARGLTVAQASAAAPTVIGTMCLPWANARHNGRSTQQERDDKEWTGTLKAAYRWNESVMTYVSAARGYKAGGFNLDRVQSSNGLSSGAAGITPVNDTSFDGEFVDSYELGAKTNWMDGNLVFNATLFLQEYTDFQLNSFLGTSFVVRSIPEVTSVGLDTEVLWQVNRNLLVQGGLVYADTTYGDDIPTPEFALPGPLYKLPGSTASFAPKWSGTAAATYQWDIGSNLIGRANVGAKYMSDYNTGSDLDVEKLQDAFAVFNARFGIGAKNKRWMLEFWGQNLLDENYVQVGFDGPLQGNATGTPGDPRNTFNAFLGAPRTYGMTFRVQY